LVKKGREGRRKETIRKLKKSQKRMEKREKTALASRLG
jgi:hypothetical protein